MSILIRDMEMPKDCRECPFEGYHVDIGQTYCMACLKVLATAFKPISFDGRSKWCPLVELSGKHGDLIDRNALKKDYRMGNDCERCETDWKSCQYDRVYSKMDFCEWIDDATVVIEAEGEG